MDSQLLSRLTTTVIHHQCTALSPYGDKTYAPPVERKCQLTRDLKHISRQFMLFDGILTVTSNDLFEIDGKKYDVISYKTFPGLVVGTGTTQVYV